MICKNPILLAGETLAPVGALHPYSLQLTLTEQPLSSCQMSIGPEDPEIRVGAWLRVYTPQGESAVYVVSAVETDITSGDRRNVTAEHAIGLLNNSFVFGDCRPALKNPSSDGDITDATPRRALEVLLGYQKAECWRLGDCDFGAEDKQPWEFHDSTILKCIDGVTACLDGWQMAFEMDALPFVLHMRRRRSEAECEMRLARNISTMRLKIDRSDMYNRVYPIGYKDMRIPEDYIEDAESIRAYGLIEHVEMNQSIGNRDMLRTYARAQLNKYKEPSVVVTITGEDLYDATGVPLDRIRVGTVCRVPLPAYGTTVLARVTQLSWQDALAQPTALTVTLSNTRQSAKNLHRIVEKIVDGTGASGGGGGRGGAGAAGREIDNYLFDEQTGAFSRIEQNLGYIRATVAGLSGVGVPTVSQIALTADSVSALVYDSSRSPIAGIRAQVTEMGNTVTTIYGQMTQITGALSVDESIIAKKTIVASSNLEVHGNLYLKGMQVITTGIEVPLGESSFTAGSVVKDTYTVVESYNTEDGELRITALKRVSLVKSVTLPALKFTKTKVLKLGQGEG